MKTSYVLALYFCFALSIVAQTNSDFTLAPNGVTCLCPNAAVGDTGDLVINGVTKTFTKRNKAQLSSLINANQADPQIALTCTSGITDMYLLFYYKSSFNQDISSWDVSNVTNMNYMFYNAISFNQPLNDWDVSSVNNMLLMFSYAKAFNQPLNDWDVSNVTNMNAMFYFTNNFNQDLSSWCVNQFTTEPLDFAYGPYIQPSFKPLWGECPTDTGVSNIELEDNFCPQTANIAVELTNFGTAELTTVDIQWSINGVSQTPVTYNTLLGSSASAIVTLAQDYNFTDGQTYTISATTALPNGVTDINTSNDSNAKSVTVGTGLINNLQSTEITAGIDYEITWDDVGTEYELEYGIEGFSLGTGTNFTNITTGSYSILGLDSNYIYDVYVRSSCGSSFGAWSSIQSSPKFTLAPNGVTCLCPNATDGDTGDLVINGVTKTFTRRNKAQLLALINVNQADPQITLTCTSGITDMSSLFMEKSSFNQDISSWDVSNVTNMNAMFYLANSFNQPLNGWDVSKVTNMYDIFYGASNFNQPLNDWDVSNVTNMDGMFYLANSFNQAINGWDVSNVTSMVSMFYDASSFNQALNDWDVSSVINMALMFSNASSFNQPLYNWNVSNVTIMAGMFSSASSFNQDISSWCVNEFTTEPFHFAIGSAIQASYKPNWGTPCATTCNIPTNLSISNIDYTTADLSWDSASSPIGGYDYLVQADGSSAPTSETTKTGSIALGSTTVGLSGLTENTTYDVFMRANCGSGNLSDWSLKASFTTLSFIISATALNFDGNSDYVSIGSVIPANSSYTKEAWIYPENVSGSNNIISSLRSPFWINDGTLFSTNNFGLGGTINISSPSTISINTWTHVAVTWDGTTMKLYINGSEVQQQTGHASYTAENINLGLHNGGNHFDGTMDEVRIWSIARTASEIQTNKDTELIGNESGLVAYYNFNTGVAGGDNLGYATLTDKTFNANNGILNNFALIGTSSNWVDGSGNGVSFIIDPIKTTALNFGGIFEYVDATGSYGTGLPQSNAARSVEFSIKTTQNSIGTVVSWGNPNQGQNSSFVVRNGKAGFIGRSRDVTGTININDDTWHHVAITYDGTGRDGMKIYVDGVLDTGPYTYLWDTGLILDTTDQNLMLGTMTSSLINFFEGSVDNIRIWDIELTASEVAQYSGADFKPAYSGLIAYFDFEDAEGNVNNSASGANVMTVNAITGYYSGTLVHFLRVGNTSNWVERDFNTWEGTVSTDWAMASNWSKGVVPISNDDVIIQNMANQPIINSSTTANLNSITLTSNATLTVEGILNTTRKIINDGELIFKSNASKTGQLDEMTGSISGTGEVTVERYIPQGKRAFRLLSPAVTTTTPFYDNWQEKGTSPTGFGTHITGVDGVNNGFDETATNNPSFFTFDNSIENQSGGAAWTAITNTDVNTFSAGTPYRLLVRGDRNVPLNTNTATATETTLRATGSLHSGDYSPSISAHDGNFNFVGNPYQAAIDFNQINFTGDINSDYIYIWDPQLGSTSAGGFVTITSLDGSNLLSSNANEFIQPGQAFFVRNNLTVNTTPSITFTEASKAVNEEQLSTFSTPNFTKLNLQLFANTAEGVEIVDAIGLRFSENFQNEVNDADAGKMGNTGENLALVNSNQLLSIEQRTNPIEGEEIELFANSYQAENYSFKLQLENGNEDLEVYIKDNYLEILSLIDEQNDYSFSVDPSIVESTSILRFSLVFEYETLSDVNFDKENYTVYPNPTTDAIFIKGISTQAEIWVYDVLGKKVLQTKIQTADEAIDLHQLEAGVYLVKVEGEAYNFTQKIIKK